MDLFLFCPGDDSASSWPRAFLSASHLFTSSSFCLGAESQPRVKRHPPQENGESAEVANWLAAEGRAFNAFWKHLACFKMELGRMRHCFCGDLPASFIISLLSSGIIHMASHSSELHEDHCHELKSCQSLQPCTPGRSEAHPLAATGALLRKPLQTWRLGCAVSILASPSRKRLLSSHQTSPVMSEQDCCIRTACCPALRTPAKRTEAQCHTMGFNLGSAQGKPSLHSLQPGRDMLLQVGQGGLHVLSAAPGTCFKACFLKYSKCSCSCRRRLR